VPTEIPNAPEFKIKEGAYSIKDHEKKYTITWTLQSYIIAILCEFPGGTIYASKPNTQKSMTISVKADWEDFDQQTETFDVSLKFNNVIGQSAAAIEQPFRFYKPLLIDKVERDTNPEYITVTIKDFNEERNILWVACYVKIGVEKDLYFRNSINWEDFYVDDQDETGEPMPRRLPVGTARVNDKFTELVQVETLYIVGVFEDNQTDEYKDENATEQSNAHFIPKAATPIPPLVW
jgi:hypothetical protein